MQTPLVYQLFRAVSAPLLRIGSSAYQLFRVPCAYQLLCVSALCIDSSAYQRLRFFVSVLRIGSSAYRVHISSFAYQLFSCIGSSAYQLFFVSALPVIGSSAYRPLRIGLCVSASAYRLLFVSALLCIGSSAHQLSRVLAFFHCNHGKNSLDRSYGTSITSIHGGCCEK